MVNESKSQFDLINILNILINNPKYFHSHKKKFYFYIFQRNIRIYFFSYLRNIDVICNKNLWKKKNRPVFFFSRMFGICMRSEKSSRKNRSKSICEAGTWTKYVTCFSNIPVEIPEYKWNQIIIEQNKQFANHHHLQKI